MHNITPYLYTNIRDTTKMGRPASVPRVVTVIPNSNRNWWEMELPEEETDDSFEETLMYCWHRSREVDFFSENRTESLYRKKDKINLCTSCKTGSPECCRYFFLREEEAELQAEHGYPSSSEGPILGCLTNYQFRHILFTSDDIAIPPSLVYTCVRDKICQVYPAKRTQPVDVFEMIPSAPVSCLQQARLESGDPELFEDELVDNPDKDQYTYTYWRSLHLRPGQDPESQEAELEEALLKGDLSCAQLRQLSNEQSSRYYKSKMPETIDLVLDHDECYGCQCNEPCDFECLFSMFWQQEKFRGERAMLEHEGLLDFEHFFMYEYKTMSSVPACVHKGIRTFRLKIQQSWGFLDQKMISV